MTGEPLALAVAEAVEPLVRRLVREEVRRAGYEWRWRTPAQARRASRHLGCGCSATSRQGTASRETVGGAALRRCQRSRHRDQERQLRCPPASRSSVKSGPGAAQTAPALDTGGLTPMSDTSFQAPTPRRGRVEGCPGLWWRRRADGVTVYEIKLRRTRSPRIDHTPRGHERTSGADDLEEGERRNGRGRQAALAERHAGSSRRRSVR